MVEKTDRDQRFRRLMFIGLTSLLLGYIGLKTWHISVALAAFETQPLERDTEGAAK